MSTANQVDQVRQQPSVKCPRLHRTAESLIVALRPYDVVPALDLSHSLEIWREGTQALMGSRTRTRYLIDTLHNARLLQALAARLPETREDDLKYITERVWGILACLLASFLEDAVRYVYKGLPIIMPMLATAAYGELWLRVKLILYDTRPDLIVIYESMATAIALVPAEVTC